MKNFFSLFCMLLSSAVLAASPWTQDTGKITEIYVNASGSVAFRMDVPFQNAISDGQCPSSNGWAGHAAADPVLKSAILAVKAAKQTVTVTISGCEGGWFKVASIYIK